MGVKATPSSVQATTAQSLKEWIEAREWANRAERESFAATSLSAADAFGLACGLMDLATRFRTSSDEPDAVREREEQQTHSAWMRLRQRHRVAQR